MNDDGYEIVGRLDTELNAEPDALAADLNQAGLSLISEVDPDGTRFWYVAEYVEGVPMPEYQYVRERFSPSGANPGLEETVDVPDQAVGVTLSTWGDPESTHDDGAWVAVKYLLPVEDDE